ncbi:hypothetical protein AGABI2DRAFT_196267 [Agaricus bisporus var. bisporus H97]|uniref:hypothetical protein n=1 Tax=Agaricus bisporus var. bisporus (strain H97 / ATCC MYA-4626 / FGSC 10389) TaxID=936046 RepID=UPI00029F50D7|nr:hypothetical protein AGABI2DRAFT_196267 [Agaricus bisporus var. bisporus H97]EKV41671.1 hypothetical protein AGABI2DRAFT_196267 [Agaricus bisporus var. bisporus H97]
MPYPSNPIETLYYTMNYVHSSIRRGLENIIKHLEESKDAIHSDLPTFVNYCLAWSHHLTMHHKLEEDFLFPVLNRTMNFSEEKDAHDVVHNKLDGLEVMLHEVEIDPKKFNPDRIREQLLALKEPLFNHLDAEVEHLKPEELKKAGVNASELGHAWQRMEEAIKASMHAS